MTAIMITSEDIQLVAEMFGVSADKVRYALERARGTKMNNRDIDKLIAEKVMGWTEIRESGFTGFDFVGLDPKHKPTDWYLIPHYSTAISAAWQVVEKLEEMDFWAQLRTPFDKGAADSFYWCGFTPRLTTGWNGRPDHWTNAPTITMAICLAALKCVGVEVEADSDPRP